MPIILWPQEERPDNFDRRTGIEQEQIEQKDVSEESFDEQDMEEHESLDVKFEEKVRNCSTMPESASRQLIAKDQKKVSFRKFIA